MGIFDSFLGGGGTPDTTQTQATGPNDIGLNDAQRQMLGYNTIGSLGAILLAAGAKQMPQQRAQMLAQLANVPNNMTNQAMQMANFNRQNALSQVQLQKANLDLQQQKALQEYVQTPEFKQQFDSFGPELKAVAQAAMMKGDLNTLAGIVEKTQPQFIGNMFINRQKGIAADLMSGNTYNLTTGQMMPQQGENAGQPVDVTKYGLPADTRVNDGVLNGFSDAYRQKLADIYYGNDSLSGAARGNAGMMQRMQMDVQRAFPDYRPLEATNRAAVLKSLASHKNGDLGGYSDSVGTMAEHFNNLADASKDLNNAPLMRWNAVANKFDSETGDPRQTRFATAANIYLSELAKVLKGGGVPTDSDKAEVAATFNRNLADGQLRSGLQTMDQMARARIDSVDSGTQRTFGSMYDPEKHSVITPYAKKQFESAANNSWLYPKQTQQRSGAPAVGNYKWSPNGGMELSE